MSLSVKDVDFGEKNVIYVTSLSDKDKAYGVEWTTPATENLLKYIRGYTRLLVAGELKTKKQVYENVSAALEEKGMFYSSAQCENKWKSLKRTYLTKNKESRRLSYKKGPYDKQVEEILRVERPVLRKEKEAYVDVNLNLPPGFTKVEPESSEEEETTPVYTAKDEELVQMVLKDSNSIEKESNYVEYESTVNDNEEHNYSYLLDNKSSNRLIEEVMQLKKVVKKNLEANTEVLNNHNATHEQILTYLDTLEKREEEKMEIKRRKLERQDDMIQQLKIQNSLIAKLIQKLGNSNK